MQLVVSNPKMHRRLRWHRFWPTKILAVIAILQLLLTAATIGLELWSMIINIKYAFFFIGFIASFIFILTWISTCNVVCCCKRSPGFATYVLILQIFSIAASSVLLYYDILFLRQPSICLWPNTLCSEDQLHLYLFGLTLGTNTGINSNKLLSIRIQIACAAVMIVTGILYILIYIYTRIRFHKKEKVTDPHTVIELGRVQPPPAPLWPETPRELPPSSEFE